MSLKNKCVFCIEISLPTVINVSIFRADHFSINNSFLGVIYKAILHIFASFHSIVTQGKAYIVFLKIIENYSFQGFLCQ